MPKCGRGHCLLWLPRPSLSYFQFQHFRRLALHADSVPTQILSSSSRINGTSTTTLIRVLPLLLEKFMPLPNAASWISMLRTIAYLFGGQLFQPVKTCSSISTVILPIISRPFIHCLSAIRSLHIKEGLPSPLVGCLRLQRVFRRIKRHQGSNKRQCEPITIELMYIIFQSFSDYSHTML